MKNLKHIFFDLDHTLWDFETNSRETLEELFAAYRPQIGMDLSFEDFHARYQVINNNLWVMYRENRISSARMREVRFREAFVTSGVAYDAWIDVFGEQYLEICPTKKALIPGAVETLEYLSAKYSLHLITNGFSEVQARKLEHSGLGSFFGHVITSEAAGAKKPQPEIFDFALSASGATRADSLYIGDDYETDVIGAVGAGIEVIYFNPEKAPNPVRVPEIQDLREMMGKY